MFKKTIFITILLFSVNSFTQENNISPYSFFGIGQINEPRTVKEQSTGVSAALNSTHKLYFANPASLASLRFTTYTLGAANNYTIIDDGANTQSSSAFGLSYLALGFPIGKKAGAAFGIQPFSKVGYNITDKYINSDNQTESNLHRGFGRINRVFIGYGHKLPYNISVGAEISYMFGSIERTILWRNLDRLDRLATHYKTETAVNGFAMKLGAQHNYKINDDLELKSGISFLLENKFDYVGNENLISALNSTNSEVIIPRDEIFNREFIGEVKNPLKTIVSVGVGKQNKWFAGVEYEFHEATLFSDSFTQRNNIVNHINYSNIGFGGFYIPKAESITNYWDRVTYSAGLHLKQTGLEINNKAIQDFGMSFGVSLPSKRQLSNVNLGFDIGKRGEIDNNGLIQENYYNFRVSLSLNDKWFRKRKLD